MTADTTTIVGQFSIVNGRWQNSAPSQVAVREPQSADVIGSGKGDLFIVTEVRGQAEELESLQQHLAEIFRDTYYMARGSITASLRRAMQVTASLLYDRNYAVGVEKRVIAGLVAAVIDGEDAFVAQVGPTACIAVLGDHTRRYPARSAWLDEAFEPEDSSAEPVLGTSLLVEPRLHHLRVGPEDVLVLADSGLVGQLPPDDVARAVNGSNVKAAIKNLGSVAQANDCSAMVLAVVAREPVKENLAVPIDRLLQRQPRPTAAAAEFAGAAAPRPKAARWLGLFKRTPGTPVSSEYMPHPSPDDLPLAEAGPKPYGETIAQDSGLYDDADEPAVSVNGGKKARVLSSVAAGVPFQAQLRQSRRPGESTFNPAHILIGAGRLLGGLVTGLLMLVALLGNGIRLLLKPLINQTDSHGYRQAGMQANKAQSKIPWGVLRTIAIAIPLLVVVIVGVSYLQKGRLLESEYQDLLTKAQNKFEQAQAITDRTAAIGLMTEARTLLTQAEQIKSGQPEIETLRQQMAERTDTMANVQRLYYLAPLRQYTDSGTSLSNIIVQGVEVFVLDTGNDRVFHHRLDDTGDALLPDEQTFLMVARGQEVDGNTVGDLQGMTWMPVGGSRQTSDLVILGSAGLMEYHPTWGIASSALASPDTLIAPVAVSSYFGNFYVLDPSANQLLRYLPTTDGYSALPESYFPVDKPVDLNGAVDLAIDGSVFILYRDGRIAKYLGGQPADFNVSGLDQPFKNPVAIHTAPNEEIQHIYVADAGNQRVVQLSKDGAFMRQFKPRTGEAVSFANLQDIYVDELGGRLYVLDSNNLYIGNIPNE